MRTTTASGHRAEQARESLGAPRALANRKSGSSGLVALLVAAIGLLFAPVAGKSGEDDEDRGIRARLVGEAAARVVRATLMLPPVSGHSRHRVEVSGNETRLPRRHAWLLGANEGIVVESAHGEGGERLPVDPRPSRVVWEDDGGMSIHLAPSQSLRGRAVYEDGSPAARCQVEVWPEGMYPFSAVGVADAQGWFDVWPLPRGAAALGPAKGGAVTGRVLQVTVPSPLPPTLVVSRAAPLQGSIRASGDARNPAGLHLSWETLQTWADGAGWPAPLSGIATLSHHGEFHAPAMPIGLPVRLTASWHPREQVGFAERLAILAVPTVGRRVDLRVPQFQGELVLDLSALELQKGDCVGVSLAWQAIAGGLWRTDVVRIYEDLFAEDGDRLLEFPIPRNEWAGASIVVVAERNSAVRVWGPVQTAANEGSLSIDAPGRTRRLTLGSDLIEDGNHAFLCTPRHAIPLPLVGKGLRPVQLAIDERHWREWALFSTRHGVVGRLAESPVRWPVSAEVETTPPRGLGIQLSPWPPATPIVNLGIVAIGDQWCLPLPPPDARGVVAIPAALHPSELVAAWQSSSGTPMMRSVPVPSLARLVDVLLR